MASATANHVRSSMGSQGQALHLGSFSRMEIADFDSRGRYPTTPSPQDTRAIPSTYSFANTMQYNLDDRPADSDINQNINGPSGSRDVVANYDTVRASAQVMSDRQEQTTLTDLENVGNAMLAGPATPTLQDPARSSLPPGPRHPQAPSRASTVPQNVNLSQQPQNTTQQPIRTGSMAPAPYPYNASPATTPTQVPTSQPNGATQTQQGSFIPTNLNYGPTMLQVQNSPRPQQPPPPEEVCIECMMRDRDMADVIVVGPGIWERESDVHLRELLEREDEEERAWRDRHAAELAIPGNKLRPPRRASKGHRLTEQNLKIWLQLNPKEAHARIMTIDAYVRQQGQLLMEEAEARAKAQQEAQRVDARVKDTYSQLRQSAYDIGTVGLANEDFASGVRIQPPRSSMYGELPSGRKEDYKHRRDMTLLENGMIMERVDLKREEKERKKEEKKVRKMSQITDTSSISPAAYMTPPPTGMDLESNGDYEVPYANMSSPSLQVSRPKSAPLGAPQKYSSHASVDGKSARFLGSKHWQAPWNSGASVAPSGSMMDMHLALDQERDGELQQFGMPMDPINQRYATSSFSLPASPRNRSRPHTADAMMHPRRSTSPDPVAKKKASGFGKLWKMVRSKKSESKHQEQSIISSLPPEDDMSMPLPPPPKMPYLNHHPQPSPHSRQVSNPGAHMGGPSQASHPRSISQPGPSSAGAISPTTAPSSILPSPTSNRFPWRESGDDRRQSTARDLNGDTSLDVAQGMNSPDPSITQQQAYGESNGMRMLVTGGSASSEYSRMLNPSNAMPMSATRSPAPSTLVSSSAHSPRPVSSVHKPLPPPPPGESANMRQLPTSPGVNGTYGGRPATIIVPEENFAPHAPFRDEGYEARRQSFSGPISRGDMLPPGAGQGLQTKRSVPAMAYMDQTSPYQEFGNPYDQAYAQPASPYLTAGALSDSGKSKRRSRFLPFLGKKDKDKTPTHAFAPQMQQQQQQQYANSEMRYSTMHTSPSSPMMAPGRPPFGHSQRSRSSASLSTPDFAPGINGTSHLAQPSFGFTEGGRPMSGISTFTTATRVNKPLIDEIVPRDPDFLAYRYPSTDQTLDVSRR